MAHHRQPCGRRDCTKARPSAPWGKLRSRQRRPRAGEELNPCPLGPRAHGATHSWAAQHTSRGSHRTVSAQVGNLHQGPKDTGSAKEAEKAAWRRCPPVVKGCQPQAGRETVQLPWEWEQEPCVTMCVHMCASAPATAPGQGSSRTWLQQIGASQAGLQRARLTLLCPAVWARLTTPCPAPPRVSPSTAR